MKVTFIGLGSMGAPMARNLIGAGHALTVYNRTPGRAKELVAQGAREVASPASAATGADAIVTMLADDVAVSATVLESGVVQALGRGAVHVSMSTISPALSRRLIDWAALAKVSAVNAGLTTHGEEGRGMREY